MDIKVSEFRLKLHPKNFHAVKEFYGDVLHFPVTDQWDNGEKDKGVMFSVGSTTLELLTPKNDYPLAGTGGTSIALEVVDVMGLWNELRDKTPVVFEPRDNSWGDTSFCISDPEGFQITFFTKT